MQATWTDKQVYCEFYYCAYLVFNPAGTELRHKMKKLKALRIARNAWQVIETE